MKEKKTESKDEVRFFNVSLINASVMSLPKFPEPQRLVGELIHSIEAASPRFAWLQFLFRRVNYSPSLVALKNDINLAAVHIKTPKTSVIDDSEYDRPELHRDWYKRSGERIKRIDSIVNSPHVLLAIQGMWVGDPRKLSSLPFKDCYDEQDRLGIFTYRNPWMLVELVRRRMVEDISRYIMSYAYSRMEPPSFLITQEEFPYYVHLPQGKESDDFGSLPLVPCSPNMKTGYAEGAVPVGGDSKSNVVRLERVPSQTDQPKEIDTQRLALLPSPSVRGFELLFEKGEKDEKGKSQLLLSAESRGDMPEYVGVLGSVYGELNPVGVSATPEFLKQIPEIVGLTKPAPFVR